MGGVVDRLPFLSSGLLVLRGLAVSFGFESPLAANLHLDLLGLGFGLLGQADLERALVIVGLDVLGFHRAGQRERAGEASVLPLDATEVLLFLFLLELALAPNSEGVVLGADINVFFVDSRDFHLQSNVVLVFVNVHRRRKAGAGQRLFWAFGTIRLTEKTVHAVYTVLQLTERFPAGQ